MAQKANRSAASITAAQIKTLHTLKNALKLTDETYRAALHNAGGVASSKDLTMYQAGALLDDLQTKATAAGVWGKGASRAAKYDDLDKRRGMMATPPQLRMIESLWHEVSRTTEPDARKQALRRFIGRVGKVSDIRFLDTKGAGAVINALTSMKKSKVKHNSNVSEFKHGLNAVPEAGKTIKHKGE